MRRHLAATDYTMGWGKKTGYSIHTWNIPLNMYFSMRNNKNRIIPISLSVSLSLGHSNYHLCLYKLPVQPPIPGFKSGLGGFVYLTLLGEDRG